MGIKDGGENSQLSFEEWIPPAELEDRIFCSEYALRDPLLPEESVTVAVVAIYTALLRPFPARVRQGETPQFLYEDTTTLAMPYRVERSLTALKTGAQEIISFQPDSLRRRESEQGASISERRENNGTLVAEVEDVEPWTFPTLTVHFASTKAVLSAPRVERVIDISLWGAVTFEERYEIHNMGPPLEGGMSRLEMLSQDDGTTGSTRGVYAQGLSPQAEAITFRDGIGNVSTSAVARQPDSTIVQLRPRYPLFGGWVTDFLFSWRQPLGETVKVAKGGMHVLVARFGPTITELSVDEVVVRVRLPPGASLVSSTTPMELRKSTARVWTLLDLAPRTELVLVRSRYVPELNTPLHVVFVPSLVTLFAKPALLSLAWGAVFAVAGLAWRAHAAIKAIKAD